MNELINVSIMNPDDDLYMSFKERLMYDNVGPEDCMMLLKPTFKIIRDKYGGYLCEKGFYSDWVRLLTLEICLADDIPSGDYVVGVEITTPCFEINQEYLYSKYHEYYGRSYQEAGNYNKIGTFFQVVIHVI